MFKLIILHKNNTDILCPNDGEEPKSMSLTKRYIFIKLNLTVFSVVIKFYRIYVTKLVFTFSFYQYKNHFEIPRVVRSPRLKFWKFLGGEGGSSKTPWNGKSWGWGGANQKVFRGGGMDIFWNHTLYISCYTSLEESDNDDLNNNLSELSTNSADETVSVSSSGYEFELDPAAKLLAQEVHSGRLPQTHLFYRLVVNSLKFATKIRDATNQFHHDPVIRSFCKTIKRRGHSRTFNLLMGKRMFKRGRGSTHEFRWEDNNIPLPLPSSRKEGYVYQSGLIQAYLIAFLRIAFSKRNDVKSLVDSDILKVIPVSLAKDGFTLKPSFEVDQHAMLVVGGQELYNLDYVQENQNIPHFAEKFVTEVEIMGITTLDNKTSLIVGNDFVGSEGDGRSTLQCHVQRLREVKV